MEKQEKQENHSGDEAGRGWSGCGGGLFLLACAPFGRGSAGAVVWWGAWAILVGYASEKNTAKKKDTTRT